MTEAAEKKSELSYEGTPVFLKVRSCYLGSKQVWQQTFSFP